MNSAQKLITSDVFHKMLLQLRNAFLEDMPEKLNRLEYLLLEMEGQDSGADAYNEFYRIAHSLKGSGGTHGLHIITTICHQLEDLLNTTDDGKNFTPQRIMICLDYVDLLRLTCGNILAGNESHSLIEKRLGELRQKLAPKKFSVLLVDDSKLSTNIYLQVLSKLPVQTVTMHDGLHALTRALTEAFDLIITTNEIPLLNGIALIGAVKLSNSKNRNTQTILITSNRNVGPTRKRITDADHTIFKDAKLAKNLAEVTMRALDISK